MLFTRYFWVFCQACAGFIFPHPFEISCGKLTWLKNVSRSGVCHSTWKLLVLVWDSPCSLSFYHCDWQTFGMEMPQQPESWNQGRVEQDPQLPRDAYDRTQNNIFIALIFGDCSLLQYNNLLDMTISVNSIKLLYMCVY